MWSAFYWKSENDYWYFYGVWINRYIDVTTLVSVKDRGVIVCVSFFGTFHGVV